jgi:hypothetical protein
VDRENAETNAMKVIVGVVDLKMSQRLRDLNPKDINHLV